MPKFVPRQRKHKVIARQKKHDGAEDGNGGDVIADPNAPEILPEEKREREERKRVLKEELVGEQKGKMSAKKKKRLDKYIVRTL